MNISIFITSYNQRDCLQEAIESVLSQTLPAEQVIIVDDASVDGSPDLISDYARRYPKLFTPIYHQKNTGVAQVRIDALNKVRGDYVSYVDGDDWLLPEKLEQEAAALKSHPDARLAFSNNEYVTEDGKTQLWVWADGEFVPQGNVFWQAVARAFPRRSLFRMELVHFDSWREIGFHDPKMQLYEDFDMRIRLTRHLKVVYVDQVLSRIRNHQGGLSHLSSERHFHALHYMLCKNRHLLATLPERQRHKAISELSGWIVPIGLQATKNSLKSCRIMKAFQLWMATMRYQKMAECL